MNAQRLLKLAEHLESGKLGHEKFDFCVINTAVDENGGYIPSDCTHSCQTTGCAIGELPIAFPRSWQFIGHGNVLLKQNTTFWWAQDAANFFKIRSDEVMRLFSPHRRKAKWNERPLGRRSTAKQVAASIRAFVKWKKKQENSRV